MTKRKPKIIKDKKLRGEWAESVFMARASELGLAVSKPWGDSRSYDCVVGRPGKFVAVQVKCTTAELSTGKGYVCSLCSSNRPYRAGSFDFVAAYVIYEDAWYIVPAKEIRGMKSISLCTEGSGAKYEKYREAWRLLRETAEPCRETETCAQEAAAVESVEGRPTGALGRLEAAMSFFQRQLERGGAPARKRSGPPARQVRGTQGDVIL